MFGSAVADDLEGATSGHGDGAIDAPLAFREVDDGVRIGGGDGGGDGGLEGGGIVAGASGDLKNGAIAPRRGGWQIETGGCGRIGEIVALGGDFAHAGPLDLATGEAEVRGCRRGRCHGR